MPRLVARMFLSGGNSRGGDGEAKQDGGDRETFLHQYKPEIGVAKRPRFGKTVARLPLSTPNQVASVAKYWSMAVVGIQRPVLVSSGPLTVSVGNVP